MYTRNLIIKLDNRHKYYMFLIALLFINSWTYVSIRKGNFKSDSLNHLFSWIWRHLGCLVGNMPQLRGHCFQALHHMAVFVRAI